MNGKEDHMMRINCLLKSALKGWGWVKVLPFYLLAFQPLANAQTPVYLDESKPVEQRIEDALSRMTLDE